MNKKQNSSQLKEKQTIKGFFNLAFARMDRQVLLLICVILAILLFFALSGTKQFFTARSFNSMAVQLPELGILALAMMVTILIGGINLSIMSIANLTAILVGFFLLKIVPKGLATEQIILELVIAALLALIIGGICGFLNGFLIGNLGVPPILATLGSSLFFIGVGLGITNGETLINFPEFVTSLSSSNIFGIPVLLIIFIVLAFIMGLILNYTIYGFKARMMGSNPTAANFSGINNRRVIVTTHILSGMLSSIAGLVIMTRTNSAFYDYGNTYVLLTILISVLGGVIAGFGNVMGVVLSIIILQILGTGFHMFFSGMRGNSFFVSFIWGVLLIVIFIINYFIRRRKERI